MSSSSPDLESVVLSCNKLAMKHLREDNFSGAMQLLNKAQDLLNYPDTPLPHQKLLAITLNNLGCYYKRTGKLSLSLHYLSQALDLPGSTPTDLMNLAGTNLNICAIRSQMQQHELGLKHASQAISQLHEAEAQGHSLEVKNTLAIAYHNAGIECEKLLKLDQARAFYKQALELAQESLGKKHPLTQAVLNSFKTLCKSVKKKFSLEALAPVNAPIKHRRKNFSFEGSKPAKLPSLKLKYRQSTRKNQGQTLIEGNSAEVPPKPPRPSRGVKSQGQKRKVSVQTSSQNAILSIESKLTSLQNQLNEFERGYRELKALNLFEGETENCPPKFVPQPPKEPNTAPVNAFRQQKLRVNKGKHAVTIQKHVKGFLARQRFKQIKRVQSNHNAKKAILELEQLKKELI